MCIRKSPISDLQSGRKWQVDRLAHELHGLTEEEIRVVEGGNV